MYTHIHTIIPPKVYHSPPKGDYFKRKVVFESSFFSFVELCGCIYLHNHHTSYPLIGIWCRGIYMANIIVTKPPSEVTRKGGLRKFHNKGLPQKMCFFNLLNLKLNLQSKLPRFITCKWFGKGPTIIWNHLKQPHPWGWSAQISNWASYVPPTHCIITVGGGFSFHPYEGTYVFINSLSLSIAVFFDDFCA